MLGRNRSAWHSASRSNLYDKAAFAARDTAALVAQIIRTREAAHG